MSSFIIALDTTTLSSIWAGLLVALAALSPLYLAGNMAAVSGPFETAISGLFAAERQGPLCAARRSARWRS